MSVAKVIEISAESSQSFEDAVNQGIARACETVEHVEGAWVKEMKAIVKDGKVVGYRVDLKITFVLNGNK